MKKFCQVLLVFVFLLGVLSGSPIYARRSMNLASTDAATVRDIWQERLRALQEEREMVREEIRMRMQDASKAAELKREEFRNRLAEIKDLRKRLTLHRIDLNLEKINEKWVEHWHKTLTRLSELLVKMQSRVDKLEEAGKDVAEVKTLIDKAKEAIADAQEAINAQAGKTYIIEVGEDGNLGLAVSTQIQKLREDLKEVARTVRLSRQAVKEVIQKLKGLVVNQTEYEKK